MSGSTLLWQSGTLLRVQQPEDRSKGEGGGPRRGSRERARRPPPLGRTRQETEHYLLSAKVIVTEAPRSLFAGELAKDVRRHNLFRLQSPANISTPRQVAQAG